MNTQATISTTAERNLDQSQSMVLNSCNNPNMARNMASGTMYNRLKEAMVMFFLINNSIQMDGTFQP